MNKVIKRIIAFAMIFSFIPNIMVSASNTSGRTDIARQRYLPYEEDDSIGSGSGVDNVVDSTNDVGYILVGESHISMSEQIIWDNGLVQQTDKAGNLELGKNIFFVHTLHEKDYQVEMHYGSSSLAYEHLNDKTLNFNAAFPEWLTQDNYTSSAGDTTEQSALTRIKAIQNNSSLKKWVVVIIQGFTASSYGDSAYPEFKNMIEDFASKLENTTTYLVCCPIPANPAIAACVTAYNNYLFDNLNGVGCYDWTEDWKQYGYETHGGIDPVDKWNHLPYSAYYEIWKQHLGNELCYKGSSQNKQPESEVEEKPNGPAYTFREENVSIDLGLSRSYKIAWVSDLHLVSNYNNLDDVVNGNAGMNAQDYIATRYSMFKTDDGSLHSVELWDEIIKYINTGGFDAVIFGGDLLDHFTNENYKNLTRGLGQIDSSIPWIYIYGSSDDHDAWTGLIGGGSVINSINNLTSSKAPNDTIDLGEFKIIGLNNSANAGINSELSSVQSSIKGAGKPVLLATHVPFESKVNSLENWSIRNHNNQVYYWTYNSYKWKLGNNSAMNNFLNENVYANNTNVKAVLAGHMHTASWDGQLTNNVKQHVFQATYRGVIGIINVS